MLSSGVALKYSLRSSLLMVVAGVENMEEYWADSISAIVLLSLIKLSSWSSKGPMSDFLVRKVLAYL